MRAAIYARVSSERQAEDDRSSLDEQIGACEAYCERRGYEVAGRYVDVGSGASRNRPEFQAMLEAGRSGGFDTIVTWKSDRLCRGIHPAAALVSVIEPYQIELEAVQDSIDVRSFQLWAAIASMERENIKERTRLGRFGAAKRGKMPTGSVPYGYRIGEDGRPEIVEEEAAVLREVFRHYADGRTVAEIMRLTDFPRHRANLSLYLGNSAYIGQWRYGSTRTTTTDSGRVRKPNPDEAVTIPFPPIIGREIFDAVQARKADRRKTRAHVAREPYLLSGLLKCSECGAPIGGRTTKKGERKYRYYSCYYSRASGRRKCRDKPNIRAAALEELIWNQVSDALTDEGLVVAHAGDDGDDLEDRLRVAKRELSAVQEERRRYLYLFGKGTIDEHELDGIMKTVTERLEARQDYLDSLRREEDDWRAAQELRAGLLPWLQGVREGLDAVTEVEKREILKLIVEDGTLNRHNYITLNLRFGRSPCPA